MQILGHQVTNQVLCTFAIATTVQFLNYYASHLDITIYNVFTVLYGVLLVFTLCHDVQALSIIHKMPSVLGIVMHGWAIVLYYV